MEHRQLGRSGLRVSALALGTMTFGGRGRFANVGTTDLDGARRHVDRCLDAGLTLVDTADVYSDGLSEEIVGQTLKGRRDRVILATKARMPMGDGPNDAGLSRQHLVASCEASLRRLGVDHIDLYQVHEWDGVTPLEETLEALDDLVRAGKVLYVGISDTPAWMVARAVTLAEERGLTPFSALQVPYSLVERTVERELLPVARALDLAVTGWAPLGGGLLTGRYGSDRARPADSRLAGIGGMHERRSLSERNLAIADAVNAVAAQRGASASQVAIAWVRAQQRRAVTIPIVGVRTDAQLADNLAAIDIDLEPDELTRLDEASATALGFPGDFGGASMAYGNTYDRIVDHRKTIDPLI
jgi:aryl-alcohol dehydrogenase-like predicted oxidoreductase